MRYKVDKIVSGYTYIIDTWNHNCVEVKILHSDNVNIIVKALEKDHIKEQNEIDRNEPTNWDNSTKHGIGTRGV